MGYIPRNKSRSIISKLKIELERLIVDSTVRDILDIDTNKPRVLSAKYKKSDIKYNKLVYKEG